ncbi:MAG: VOC family protein [Rhodobacteraceae bacterium]|nr:VOC family protein [Paracoccaceae bacterium]
MGENVTMRHLIQSPETTIDHVGLVGRAIAPMVEAYRRLGFEVTTPADLMQPGPDGNPVPLGQVSAHAIFANTYVELTAVLDPGQGNHLDNWLARHEGLHILAFHAEDAQSSWDELAAHGLVMPPMRAATR